MSEPEAKSERGADVPDAVIETRKGISIVWLIPLVAALIGGWLTYRAISERGPEVTITFKTAEGLESGKTKIKYKDLEMGLVESIELSEDLSYVTVTARMAKGAERYLKRGTRFWIMRASVSGGQVSGLGTLFSGAYIGIDPVLDGKAKRTFRGLEVPPVVTARDSGRLFVLQSPTQGSIEIGSPVYYRKVKVGQVVANELDAEGQFVTIKVFISSPHDARIRTTTHFWNASGIDVTLDADGVRLETESIVSILLGGISFDTPELSQGEPVTADTVFPLFPDRRATMAKTYTLKQRYLLHFAGSVAGLVPGSSVEFRGMEIGHVTEVSLQFDVEAEDFRIPIVIEVEPERIEIIGGAATEVGERLGGLVARGLRARLKTANLLTGRMAVELDLHPEAPPATVVLGGAYPELPTLPTPLEEITASLSRLVGRIEQLPLEQMGKDVQLSLTALRTTLEHTQTLTKQLSADVTPAVVAAAREAEKTLASAGNLVGPESTTSVELKKLLIELVAAAKSVRLMAESLEQNPESLLRGKENAQ